MATSTVMQPGRVALVTGATKGIGRAVAEDLVNRGLKVVCCARNKAALTELFGGDSGNTFPLELDVSDPRQVADRISNLPSEFKEIDVLVASAGSDVGGREPFCDGAMEDWAGTIATNVTGLIACCHAVLPGMLDRNRGHIVTIGSVSGLMTYAGGSIYAASKHAVRAFTEGLRKDYPTEPVRITEIMPGLVRTSFAEARLKGDQQKAGDYYDNAPDALNATDISATVLYALDAPDHVNIAQLLVMPTGSK